MFDNEVPDEWRTDLFALIAQTPNLDWLLLTKRIGNAAEMIRKARMCEGEDIFYNDPISNVWLGATIANREEMLRDAPKLKAAPAKVRFWSVEPMLGDLGIIPPELMPDWVINGGESNNGRPMHPAWVRRLRDQCLAAGTPYFFKQWGDFANIEASGLNEDECYEKSKAGGWVEPNGSYSLGELAAPKHKEASHVFKMGKRLTGRMLDGILYHQFPR